MLTTATSQRARIEHERCSHLRFVCAREQDARCIPFGIPLTAGMRIGYRRRYRRPILEAEPGTALHRRRSP